MASTYSSNLRFELIGAGEQVGTWGTTANTNLGTLIEGSVAGFSTVSVTASSQAFTANNGADDQARKAMVKLTTTTGANFAVYAPPVSKLYVVYNASSYTATIYNSTVIGNTTAAGVGIVVPAGKVMAVWTDGTDFRDQATHMASLTLTTDLAVADGGTGAGTAADARTNLGAAASGANSDITSLTGLTTALSVAQGGTGATTAGGARTNLGAVNIAGDTMTGTLGVATPTASGHATTKTYVDTSITTAVAAAVPTGVVMHFAANSPPTGWLECDGSAKSRTTYAALFAITGTTFGAGDGATTFNLPDLRGYTIRGWDHGRGVDSGRSFGSNQSDQNLAHTHTVTGPVSGSSGSGNTFTSGSTFQAPDNANIGTATSTGSGGTEVRVKNVALLPCIKT